VDQDVPADLIVVCPPAATGARETASRYGARVLDDPGSLSAAVNLGLAQATEVHHYGNWIGDDDLLAPGSLAATCDALDRDSSAVVAFGACTYVNEEGRPLWVSRAGRSAVWMLSWGPDLASARDALPA
jgi:hypothetical protein